MMKPASESEPAAPAEQLKHKLNRGSQRARLESNTRTITTTKAWMQGTKQGIAKLIGQDSALTEEARKEARQARMWQVCRVAHGVAIFALLGEFILLGGNDIKWLSAGEITNLRAFQPYFLELLFAALVVFNYSIVSIDKIPQPKLAWLVSIEALVVLGNILVGGFLIMGVVELWTETGRLDFQHLPSIMVFGVAVLEVLALAGLNALIFKFLGNLCDIVKREKEQMEAQALIAPRPAIAAPPAVIRPAQPQIPEDVLD